MDITNNTATSQQSTPINESSAEQPSINSCATQFESINDFRKRATEEDMQNLETYIINSQNKTKAFPNETYQFSYSAAASYLRTHGYLGGNKPKEEDAKAFIIEPGIRPTDYTSRTFTIEQSILDRIDRLSDAQWLYNKKAIVNKLLDEALKIYGY